jgi:hypothetical protein
MTAPRRRLLMILAVTFTATGVLAAAGAVAYAVARPPQQTLSAVTARSVATPTPDISTPAPPTPTPTPVHVSTPTPPPVHVSTPTPPPPPVQHVLTCPAGYYLSGSRCYPNPTPPPTCRAGYYLAYNNLCYSIAGKQAALVAFENAEHGYENAVNNLGYCQREIAQSSPYSTIDPCAPGSLLQYQHELAQAQIYLAQKQRDYAAYP